MEFLRLENLVKYYPLRKHFFSRTEYVQAVAGVNLSVDQGESFGIVGESGCGKSTLAQLIAMLEIPTAGQVYFDNRPVTGLSKAERRQLRRDVQIVFQDTCGSLNPRCSIGDTLAEPLLNFNICDRANAGRRIQATLDAVQISSALLTRYPHELSGGQRQRIAIARAIVLKPRFIIFDEVTSGLDAVLQQQVLQLLKNLRRELNLTCLFITHNLRILPHVTDRVGVM